MRTPHKTVFIKINLSQQPTTVHIKSIRSTAIDVYW